MTILFIAVIWLFAALGVLVFMAGAKQLRREHRAAEVYAELRADALAADVVAEAERILAEVER